MKKLFLSLILTLCFIACSRTENEIPVKLESLSEDEAFEAGLESIYGEALSIATRQKVIFKASQYYNVGIYVFDPVEGLSGVSDSINQKLFNGKGNIFPKNARLIGTQNMPPPPTVQAIKDVIINSSYPYTADQKTRLTNLFDNIFALSDDVLLEQAQWVLNGFAVNVHWSSMPSEQKKELLNYCALVRTIFTYVKNGGIGELYNGILSVTPYNPNGRTMACQINTRSLLISVMVDGVAGAVSGALYGAVGGTFTIPGLGTVTGAIGGAVFGGITAIAGSTVKNIVSQLVESCTRNIQLADASCSAILHNFLVANSTTQQQLMQNNPHCFKLDTSDLYLNPIQVTENEALVISKYQAVSFQY